MNYRVLYKDTVHCDFFIHQMIQKIPREIIEYMVKKYIYLPCNIFTIKYQKFLKKHMLRQLLFISNIIHIDSNACIYVDNQDIVIHNYNNHNEHYSIFSNTNSIISIETSNNYSQNTSNILHQISNTLYIIQNNINNYFQSLHYDTLTSNIVIHTNNHDMDNATFYIIYI